MFTMTFPPKTGPDFGEQTKHKISYRPNGIACSIHYGFVFYIPYIHLTRRQRITPSTGFTRSIAAEK